MSRPPSNPDPGGDAARRLTRAKEIYRFRRSRNGIFAHTDLFGEPAYDILLDLYICHHENRPVSVSDACHAADVPSSTALRHLKMLHERGFIRRLPDPNDRRRCYVMLEPQALCGLDRLLRD